MPWRLEDTVRFMLYVAFLNAREKYGMKLSATLFFAIALLFSATQVHALPLLYTFKGNIVDIDVNGSNVSSAIVDGVAFAVGESLTYSFAVDFQRSGNCVDPSKVTAACNGGPITDVPGYDYFSAELFTATKMAPPTYLDNTYAYGESWLNAGFGRLTGDSAIYVSTDAIVQNWTVATLTSPATLLTGYDAWDNAVDYYGLISSDLTLVSIVPIPEPTQFALLPLGIVCLAVARNMRRAAQR